MFSTLDNQKKSGQTLLPWKAVFMASQLDYQKLWNYFHMSIVWNMIWIVSFQSLIHVRLVMSDQFKEVGYILTMEY